MKLKAYKNFYRVVDELKTKPGYKKVLAVSQGLVTWFFSRLETSPMNAFREMVAKWKRDLEREGALAMNLYKIKLVLFSSSSTIS